MRILHVSQPHAGGVAVYVRDLARAQRRAGHEVLVACPPSSGPLADLGGDAGAPAASAGVAAWPARRSPGRGLAGELRRLRAIVAAHDPDVVHLHAAKAGLVGRLVVRGRRPTIVQPHAWSFVAAGRLRPLVTAWERWASRWTDLVICVSRGEATAGRDAGVQAPITVVPNGVDLDRLAPSTAAVERLGPRGTEVAGGVRDESGSSMDGPTVVCVGRLCEQKGQDLLLAAWPDVVRDHPSARLLLVGDGPERAELERQARGLHRVHFVGWQDDVQPWLSRADLVVMPSRWEGMALTLLEAGAAGRAVVVSDVWGVSDVVAGTPVTAAVVPTGDVEALGAAIGRRLADPERRRIEAAALHARVRDAHGDEVTHERVSALTVALTGRSSRCGVSSS